MPNLITLPAREIARRVAARDLSARDVTRAFLARIAALNPVVNAVCTINPAAEAEAAAIDTRLARGEAARPLEGVPVLVKDNIETRGLRTTWGSRLRSDHVPAVDAVVVERLRAAGAVILGKSNTPEFAADPHTANPVFGTTRNPWDLMRTAGGSSGGTGAGIAAGFAPVGLGTDFGGSIRIPASFNGIVGIRPAPGRVPISPSDYGWDTLVEHVVGPLAATVTDAALMLAVLAGPDDRDPSSLPDDRLDFVHAAEQHDIKGRRFAYVPDLGGLAPLDTEVGDIVGRAVQSFNALGGSVGAAHFDASDLRDIIQGTRGYAVIARFAEFYAGQKDLLTPQVRAQVEASLTLDVATVARAEKLRTAYWRRVATLFETCDLILAPTCGAPPFRLDEPLPTTVGGRAVARFYDIFLHTYGYSVTGLPAVAVPCGFTSSGLPVGLQILARRNREDLAIAAAAAFEAANPDFFRRPTIQPETAGPIPPMLPAASAMMGGKT